ncbi:hypothetical protein RJ641_017156, partial [Dillenia turbinata]
MPPMPSIGTTKGSRKMVLLAILRVLPCSLTLIPVMILVILSTICVQDVLNIVISLTSIGSVDQFPRSLKSVTKFHFVSGAY